MLSESSGTRPGDDLVFPRRARRLNEEGFGGDLVAQLHGRCRTARNQRRGQGTVRKLKTRRILWLPHMPIQDTLANGLCYHLNEV